MTFLFCLTQLCGGIFTSASVFGLDNDGVNEVEELARTFQDLPRLDFGMTAIALFGLESHQNIVNNQHMYKYNEVPVLQMERIKHRVCAT